MESDWLILHGGALGDLVLTIQLALRLPGVADSGVLRVVSRVNPGNLSVCRPSIVRRSSEGLGLHWLFGGGQEGIPAGPGAKEDSRTSGSRTGDFSTSTCDDPPPERLRELVRGMRVLSALDSPDTTVHQRLVALEPAAAYSFDARPGDGVERHITQQWQTQLEAQGLLVPKCIHQRPMQRGHTVVIHPGSGGRSKCWPLRGFVEVARRLQQDHQAAVCFLVGPVELEQWAEREFAALADEFPLLRCLEADELVALLAAARAFVGNDAGPGHLAALLGTPTVTIFGPTSARVWRPLGPSAQVIVGDPVRDPATWGVDPAAVASTVRALVLTAAG